MIGVMREFASAAGAASGGAGAGMDCWIVIRAFSSEVGTGSREENASKREAGARRLQGRKLQNFAARSYSLTCVVRVFHAPCRPHACHRGITAPPRKHRGAGMPQLTCRGHAPKTRHQSSGSTPKTRHSGRDSMRDVFICDAVRTPIGRFGGSLAKVRADDLAATPIKALMAKHPNL